MSNSELVTLERLQEERYGRILCYPRYDSEELRRRIKELKELGVQVLIFTGQKRVMDVPVLGKGYVGIVVGAMMGRQRVALKIRRTDANRTSMQHEAEMLRKANAVHVAPNLIDVTEDFLVMELVEGRLLPKWIEEVKENPESRIRCVLQAVLEQCWRLDKAGLDHGELSRTPKHIIVDTDDKPFIVDFEAASIMRRVSNVTSICQYLFIGSQMVKTIKNTLVKVDTEELIKVLRVYKQSSTKENFERVLEVCGLRKV